MLKFAPNLSMMYQEYAFLDRFAAAAQDGFRGVEYLFPYDYPVTDLRARLRDTGLAQALFNAPPGDWAGGERGLAVLPGREAQFRASIERALEYAAELDCPSVHVMAGIAPVGIDRLALENRYLENLSWAAGKAASAGTTLLIEPINTRDMPGYFLNLQAHAHTVVQSVASPALKVQMDLYHCQIMEGDLTANLQRYLPTGCVGHIQVAGVPARQEPDRGEVNYSHVFGVLDALEYAGWIGCEYRPAGVTRDGLAWLGCGKSGKTGV